MSSSPESPILLIVDNRRTRRQSRADGQRERRGVSWSVLRGRYAALRTRGLAVTISLTFSSRAGNKAVAPVFRECGGWFHSRLK